MWRKEDFVDDYHARNGRRGGRRTGDTRWCCGGAPVAGRGKGGMRGDEAREQDERKSEEESRKGANDSTDRRGDRCTSPLGVINQRAESPRLCTRTHFVPTFPQVGRVQSRPYRKTCLVEVFVFDASFVRDTFIDEAAQGADTAFADGEGND